MFTQRFTVLTSIVVAAAASRLIPHAPNFTPMIALALFGGAYYDSKRLSYAVPLLAMVLSDLGLAVMNGYAFFAPMRLVVYGCFALITTIGFLLRDNRRAASIALASLASSLLFYFITNLAEWAEGHLYPMNSTGLIACYVAAIPFFKHTLSSALIYSAVLFGGFELAKHRFPVLGHGEVNR